jgi:hypothetical protein
MWFIAVHLKQGRFVFYNHKSNRLLMEGTLETLSPPFS